MAQLLIGDIYFIMDDFVEADMYTGKCKGKKVEEKKKKKKKRK